MGFKEDIWDLVSGLPDIGRDRRIVGLNFSSFVIEMGVLGFHSVFSSRQTRYYSIKDHKTGF